MASFDKTLEKKVRRPAKAGHGAVGFNEDSNPLNSDGKARMKTTMKSSFPQQEYEIIEHPEPSVSLTAKTRPFEGQSTTQSTFTSPYSPTRSSPAQRFNEDSKPLGYDETPSYHSTTRSSFVAHPTEEYIAHAMPQPPPQPRRSSLKFEGESTARTSYTQLSPTEKARPSYRFNQDSSPVAHDQKSPHRSPLAQKKDQARNLAPSEPDAVIPISPRAALTTVSREDYSGRASERVQPSLRFNQDSKPLGDQGGDIPLPTSHAEYPAHAEYRPAEKIVPQSKSEEHRMGPHRPTTSKHDGEPARIGPHRPGLPAAQTGRFEARSLHQETYRGGQGDKPPAAYGFNQESVRQEPASLANETTTRVSYQPFDTSEYRKALPATDAVGPRAAAKNVASVPVAKEPFTARSTAQETYRGGQVEQQTPRTYRFNQTSHPGGPLC